VSTSNTSFGEPSALRLVRRNWTMLAATQATAVVHAMSVKQEFTYA
jgi:hypothetical protein